MKLQPREVLDRLIRTMSSRSRSVLRKGGINNNDSTKREDIVNTGKVNYLLICPDIGSIRHQVSDIDLLLFHRYLYICFLHYYKTVDEIMSSSKLVSLLLIPLGSAGRGKNGSASQRGNPRRAWGSNGVFRVIFSRHGIVYSARARYRSTFKQR